MGGFFFLIAPGDIFSSRFKESSIHGKCDPINRKGAEKAFEINNERVRGGLEVSCFVKMSFWDIN